MRNSPRVVIVGAGFGGLQAAQSLANSGADIILIDRNSYHTFVPLLYQVATGQLEPELIAYPVRTLARRQRHLHVLRTEVRQVNFAAQIVETDSGAIAYDFLVLATGSQTQFLGVPGAAEHAFSMRTLEEAIALRNHIFTCLEEAAQTPDQVLRQQLLSFVIVGGGPTGVELAGALVETIRGRLQYDYPTLDLKQVQISLVQSSDRLLADLPQQLGHYTQARLRQLGVDVYPATRVSQVTADGVQLSPQQHLAAATVIWTAGLEAHSPEVSDELARASKRKVKVRSTLQTLTYPNVYAVGDVAYVEQAGQELTGVAPEALQQGVAVARNIKRQLRGQAPTPFNYFNKGRLAIIGYFSGVGKIGPWAFRGFLAWLMWLGVHLVYLPGYRNRLMVMLSWLHGYALGDRPVRVILPVGHADRQRHSASRLASETLLSRSRP